jgi:hypothetical protein
MQRVACVAGQPSRLVVFVLQANMVALWDMGLISARLLASVPATDPLDAVLIPERNVVVLVEGGGLRSVQLDAGMRVGPGLRVRGIKVPALLP